jgi:hypothetical protein
MILTLLACLPYSIFSIVPPHTIVKRVFGKKCYIP